MILSESAIPFRECWLCRFYLVDYSRGNFDNIFCINSHRVWSASTAMNQLGLIIDFMSVIQFIRFFSKKSWLYLPSVQNLLAEVLAFRHLKRCTVKKNIKNHVLMTTKVLSSTLFIITVKCFTIFIEVDWKLNRF